MQMLRARCATCAWDYDCVAIPMEAIAACGAMASQSCPMCGNRKGNTVAAPRALTADEQRHKSALIAKAAAPPPVETT